MKLTVTSTLSQPSPPVMGVTLSDKPLHRVFMHTDVWQWLEDNPPNDPIAKRIRYNLQCLMYKGFSPKAKGVVGDLRGWRRALLGGNGGSHFYLWYVPAGIDIGRDLGLPEGSIAVRARRHHDDFAALDPGILEDDYLEVSTRDIGICDVDQTPYTVDQVRIATQSSASVTMLRGYPGSGKTTSLMLSALHGEAGKMLYVTYSEKLATEARQYFSTFRPEHTSIEVMTFNELLHYLEDTEPVTPVPASVLARGLVKELSKKPNLLKFLAEQPDELYAELHAQAVGRALPLRLGNHPAADGDFVRDYHTLRESDVGTDMAQLVSNIIEYIRQNNLVDRYFSPLVRARRSITDINEPPPPRLEGCSMVLVDEVQDLTQIEALLLLNVCARIGTDSGHMPRIILAGDESQTVRPTDFKWSWLKNLVTTVFDDSLAMTDEVLNANLRSPKQIARFVEATRSQYAKFDKSDRPSGMTYTTTDDSFVGRVMYCVAHGDNDIDSILEAFSRITRSCLVYPGFVAPEDLIQSDLGAQLVMSAEDVKGLDYDVVGLIDAGTRQADLDKLLSRRSDEPYVDLFGRTLADQYRVAASRAAETLVLIDRNGADFTEQIRQFCASRSDQIELELVEVTDLATMLHDDVDQEEFIRSSIEEIGDLLEVQTERAILRSASLVKQMERLKVSGGHDPSLDTDVKRLRSVALLAGLLFDGEFQRLDRDSMSREARHLTQQINMGDAFQSVLDLANEKSSWSDKKRLDALWRAMSNIEDVQRELPEIFRKHEARILRWHDRLLQNEVPVDQSKRMQVLDVAHAITDYLGDDHDYLLPQTDSIRSRWADQLVRKREYSDALTLLRGRATRDFLGEGHCLRSMKSYLEAASAFEQGSMPEDAIECLRLIPDIEGAIRIAESSGSDTLSTLRWMQEVRGLLTMGRDAAGGELTDAEVSQLIQWARDAKRNRRMPAESPDEGLAF